MKGLEKLASQVMSLQGRLAMRIFIAFMLPLAAMVLHKASLPLAYAAEEKPLKDSAIALAVAENLRADDSVPAPLEVDVRDGIVTLSGSVDRLFAKQRATEVAQAVRGTRAVVNTIAIRPVPRTDPQIHNEVVTALARDPATDSFEIDVNVTNGIVTLRGTVESWNEQQLAARVAKDVKGVRTVKNQLRFTYPAAERPDTDIAADIRRRLEWDAWVAADLINVAVRDGKVTLRGAVGSADEKSRAYSDAWVAGVRWVDHSDLQVEWWARDRMRAKSLCATKTDEDIQAAVKDAFHYDPRVRALTPQVQVTNATVTLTGTVNNLKAKQAAAADAENTFCVRRVQNYLQVRPETQPSDAVLAQWVRTALSSDPYTNRDDIDLTVENGTVFLEGTVDSSFVQARAEDVVSRVRGVVEIKNNLAVNPVFTHREDWEIKHNIEQKFFWSPLVDHEAIAVSVQDGVATLTGRVNTWLEHGIARQYALAGGARQVRADLQVRGWPQEESQALGSQEMAPNEE